VNKQALEFAQLKKIQKKQKKKTQKQKFTEKQIK